MCLPHAAPSAQAGTLFEVAISSQLSAISFQLSALAVALGRGHSRGSDKLDYHAYLDKHDYHDYQAYQAYRTLSHRWRDVSR